MALALQGLSWQEDVRKGAPCDSAVTSAPWPSANLAFDLDGGLTTRSTSCDGDSPSHKLEPAYIQVKSVGGGGPAEVGTMEHGLLSEVADGILCPEVGEVFECSFATVGSIGHPHSCAAACKYHDRARGCKDGAMCTHCHHCRWNRYAQPKHRGSRSKQQKASCV